jgi:hypothetical protein
MPCYEPEPTKQELEQSQKTSNHKKYGLALTDSELIATILNYCCEMGQVLHSYDLLDLLSIDSRNWYLEHNERDRKEQEKQEMRNKIYSLKTELNKLEYEYTKYE